MFTEFVASETSMRTFAKAAHELRSIGAYAVLLELLARKSAALAERDVQYKVDPATAAVQREAWSRGYYEALKDIFNFQQHAQLEKPFVPQVTFGAAESLVADNTITEDEYTKLTGRPWTGE